MKKRKKLLRDDTHMTPMKIVQFSRSPPPLSIYVQNSSTPLTLGVQFQTKPSPPFPLQMITNQLKENIIQGWLLYLIRSFNMMSGHGANSLIKNKDWTSRKLVNPPPLTSDNISFFLYPLPLKVDVMCVSPLM